MRPPNRNKLNKSKFYFRSESVKENVLKTLICHLFKAISRLLHSEKNKSTLETKTFLLGCLFVTYPSRCIQESRFEFSCTQVA